MNGNHQDNPIDAGSLTLGKQAHLSLFAKARGLRVHIPHPPALLSNSQPIRSRPHSISINSTSPQKAQTPQNLNPTHNDALKPMHLLLMIPQLIPPIKPPPSIPLTPQLPTMKLPLTRKMHLCMAFQIRLPLER